jgi:chromatin remodeling complex protein RSC6
MARVNKKQTLPEQTPVVTMSEVVETPQLKKTSKIPKEITENVSQPKEPKEPRARKPKVEKQEVVSSEVIPDVSAQMVETQHVGDVMDAEPIVLEQSVELLAKLQQLSVIVSAIKSDFRQIEKRFQKDLKVAQKHSNKKKRNSGNRAPSGFVKPTRISDELAGFLEKPIGTEMARTSVTRDINAYIRSNNLQDKDNGRKINPDKKLSSLLKLTPEDELTYFNLQKYMSSHFAKSVKVEPVVVVASE